VHIRMLKQNGPDDLTPAEGRMSVRQTSDRPTCTTVTPARELLSMFAKALFGQIIGSVLFQHPDVHKGRPAGMHSLSL